MSDEAMGNRPFKASTEGILVREYAEANDLGDIATRDAIPYGSKGKFDAWARGRVRELTGQVPAKTTYTEWFERQSAEFQRDVLGPSRFKLYSDSDLTLDKFAGDDYRKLTLKELVRKDRQAFLDAGLDPEDFL
jgi:hypothetical protein